MRSLANLLKAAAVAASSALLLLGTPAVQADTLDESPSAAAIVADTVVVRPLYFALAQVGTAVYTATLPFTLLGGNADEVAETMVVTPLQGAFIRCLGCGKIDNQIKDLSEADGSKSIKHFLRVDGGLSIVKVNGKSDNSSNIAVHAGTNFSLVDGSRFDVMLGAAHLGSADAKGAAAFDDDITSFQIANRFGRQLGTSSVDMMFKLGGHYYELKRDWDAGGSSKSTGVGFLAGAGFDYWVADSTRLGLEYSYYRMSKLPTEYSQHLSTVNLNLSFMF